MGAGWLLHRLINDVRGHTRGEKLGLFSTSCCRLLLLILPSLLQQTCGWHSLARDWSLLANLISDL